MKFIPFRRPTSVNPSHHRRCFGKYTKNKKPKEKPDPIMTKEILHTFNTKYPSGTILDASFGDGGHSINLIKSSFDNHVIGMDCDQYIASPTAGYLQHKYRENNRFHFIHSKWSNMYRNLQMKLPEISSVDGILLETGIAPIGANRNRSQIFDLKSDNLDLRCFTTTPKWECLAVRDLLKHPNLTESLLSDILTIFGDQNKEISTKIARGLLAADDEVATFEDLVFIIGSVLRVESEEYLNPMFIFNKRKASWIRNDHPVRKTINALTRFINNSIIELSYALRQSELLLRPKGTLILIVYDHLESRIVADFLKSRHLLNMDPDNTAETAIVYVDEISGEAMDTTFNVSETTSYLKERNERLGDHDWHGIAQARFNDFNAVPFIQPHIAEISTHPRGKYARMLVLERTKRHSNEVAESFLIGDKLETETLTADNLHQVVAERCAKTSELLNYSSHNAFLP